MLLSIIIITLILLDVKLKIELDPSPLVSVHIIRD